RRLDSRVASTLDTPVSTGGTSSARLAIHRMLNIASNPRGDRGRSDLMIDDRLGCEEFRRLGVSRRAAVRAGVLGLTGLNLPGLLTGRASASSAGRGGFGRARSCILIFQWGGPSHLDTWDPKPDAPEDIRGTFSSIETATPGVRISEHFPLLAKQTHRL